jgi:recombination protein RecR
MCCDFCEKSPCQICSDLKRDRSIICVVAEPQDSETIEKTNSYSGLYHILRGTLEPEENLDESKLKIKELIKRAHDSKIKEIMLALNPDMQGEATMMYLEKKIKEANPKIKITRLAKGLPTGSDLQYADEITLASAIKNRTIKKDPL